MALVAAMASCMIPALAQTPAPAAVPPASQPAIPAPVTQPLPPSRWTPAQIREAFQLADVNSDGQLTRAEAQRLAIMPRSFEDTDANKDGVLTLDEYQASFAQ
jgi:Ca2+-binding EF-hand superfamily protein